jgi:transcriptional regulator with XRE-family HTH domain
MLLTRRQRNSPRAQGAAQVGTGRFGSNHVTSFGQRVRWLREARGWSIQRLAREAGLSVIAIRNLESGSADPRLHSALAIAEALGEPIDRLIASARAASVSVRLLEGANVPGPVPEEVQSSDITGEMHEPRMAAQILVMGARTTVDAPKALNRRPTFCYVLDGGISVSFPDGDVHHLQEGDAIHFAEAGEVQITTSRNGSARVLRVIDLASRLPTAPTKKSSAER